MYCVSLYRHGLSSLCLPVEDEAVAVSLPSFLTLSPLLLSLSSLLNISVTICIPFLLQLCREADSLVLSPGTWFGLLSCPYLVS